MRARICSTTCRPSTRHWGGSRCATGMPFGATSRIFSDANGSRWKATERSLFRSVFTEKDPDAEPVLKGKRQGEFEADAELRDFENVPLKDDVDDYFEREVRPHVPDAWMDRDKDRIGYEINFNRHFYRYTPPRPLEEIDADLKKAEEEMARLLREVVE